MLKPRQIRNSRSFEIYIYIYMYAGVMRDRYFVCSDANIFPRDEVRTYFVVKGERESFVTEEEGSLRRECYVDG